MYYSQLFKVNLKLKGKIGAKMTESLKYIFFLKDGKMCSWLLRGDRLESPREKGEISIEYGEKYWEWWKRKESYIDEIIDICLILEDENELNLKTLEEAGINIIDNSLWDSDEILDCLENKESISEYVRNLDAIKIFVLKSGKLEKISIENDEIKKEEKVEKKRINKNIKIKVDDGKLAKFYKTKTIEYEKNKY